MMEKQNCIEQQYPHNIYMFSFIHSFIYYYYYPSYYCYSCEQEGIEYSSSPLDSWNLSIPGRWTLLLLGMVVEIASHAQVDVHWQKCCEERWCLPFVWTACDHG